MILRRLLSTRFILVAALGVSFALVPWGGLISPTGSDAAWAQKASRAGKSQKKTRKVPTLSERVFKKLMEAQDLMEAEQLNEAREVLLSAQKIRRLKPYDQAMIHQMIGFIYSNEENYAAAVKEFEKLLAVGAESVPEGVLVSTLYNMSQMYMVLEEWQMAKDILNRWFEVVPEPGAGPHIFMAQIHAQLEQYKEAVPWAEKAIAMENARGRAAKENWYQLLMSMHFSLKDARGQDNPDYPAISKVLEVLVDIYPKKSYWLQLAAVYGEMNQEKAQLGVMEVAYIQGFFDRSNEFISLAQYFLYHEVPYKAAMVLEKGLKDKSIEPDQKNWELLANSLMNAAEFDRAIPYLAQAASMADDGELYIRLGQAHMENEDWKDAVKAFEDGVEKGDLKNTGTAYLLTGMASFNGDDFKTARAAFREARKFDDVAKTARQWLRHLDQEERRRASL